MKLKTQITTLSLQRCSSPFFSYEQMVNPFPKNGLDFVVSWRLVSECQQKAPVFWDHLEVS